MARWLSAVSSTATCPRYEGLSGRRSTITSRTAPRVQRTTFVSAAGGYWKWTPRTDPLNRLKPMFACAMTGFRPCSANSFWQKARAKKPRLSSLRSSSMTNAPLSFVSSKITGALLIRKSVLLPQFDRLFRLSPELDSLLSLFAWSRGEAAALDLLEVLARVLAGEADRPVLDCEPRPKILR